MIAAFDTEMLQLIKLPSREQSSLDVRGSRGRLTTASWTEGVRPREGQVNSRLTGF